MPAIMSVRMISLVLGLAGCGRVQSSSPVDAASPATDALLDAASPATDALVDAAIDVPPPDTGPRPTNLAVESEIIWRTGDAPIDAGETANRFCFLTGVTGMFKAPQHAVRVAAVGTRWLVSGDGDAMRSARVRCVTYDAASGIAVSPAFDWTQGSAAVDMGAFANQLCALTRIAGTFNGGGELVHAAGENNRWLLRGTSLAAGVSVSAHCLTFPVETAVAIGGEVNWAQGDPVHDLGPAAHRACVMTLFVGSFLGDAESVAITLAPASWLLGGSSAQQGVAARARCYTW
jgi:hypothetical protein